MTRLMTLTLIGACALSPLLANAQTLIQRQGGGDPIALGLTAATPTQSPTGPSRLAGQAAAPTTAAPNNDFCGIHDVFYWYEEDENGNEIDGTRQWGCTD